MCSPSRKDSKGWLRRKYCVFPSLQLLTMSKSKARPANLDLSRCSCFLDGPTTSTTLKRGLTNLVTGLDCDALSDNNGFLQAPNVDCHNLATSDVVNYTGRVNQCEDGSQTAMRDSGHTGCVNEITVARRPLPRPPLRQRAYRPAPTQEKLL